MPLGQGCQLINNNVTTLQNPLWSPPMSFVPWEGLGPVVPWTPKSP